MILDGKFFKAMIKKQDIVSFTGQEGRLQKLLYNKVQVVVNLLHKHQAELENCIEFVVAIMIIVGVVNIVYGILINI